MDGIWEYASSYVTQVLLSVQRIMVVCQPKPKMFQNSFDDNFRTDRIVSCTYKEITFFGIDVEDYWL